MLQYSSNTLPSFHRFGKVYIISKGIIKPAKKEFNHLKNDLGKNLSNTSTIEACLHDDHSIANHNLIFTPNNELSTLTNNSIVDILGIIIFISPLVTIMRKNRTLQLKDKSNYNIEVTLWGSCALDII